ncbi:hypothetical protein AB0D66_22690 [Streptomyces sp. NPDC048270]|uniref:hypothetical protein n=1 Tax=Streptomyces sp. NPDC048270 TaxID=3154615 RepID=UPI0033C79AB2
MAGLLAQVLGDLSDRAPLTVRVRKPPGSPTGQTHPERLPARVRAPRDADAVRAAVRGTDAVVHSGGAPVGSEVTPLPDTYYGLSKAFGENLASLYADKYGGPARRRLARRSEHADRPAARRGGAVPQHGTTRGSRRVRR